MIAGGRVATDGLAAISTELARLNDKQDVMVEKIKETITHQDIKEVLDDIRENSRRLSG
jgi:hypothetical protein